MEMAMKTNDKQTNATQATETAQTAFALPDLSKPARGIRVRSRLRAGALASDETM